MLLSWQRSIPIGKLGCDVDAELHLARRQLFRQSVDSWLDSLDTGRLPLSLQGFMFQFYVVACRSWPPEVSFVFVDV